MPLNYYGYEIPYIPSRFGGGQQPGFPPLDLVGDSKDSRHLEEDNNKMDRHLHRRHPTRHKNHPLYTLLTLELSEAAFTAIPIFG